MLRVEGIAKSFDGVAALLDVSLEARPGEVVALAGENGAGKSTLMRILAGLERPDRGSVTLPGPVAMIHQELQNWPALSVAENLLLGREPAFGPFVRRGALRAHARRALERLGCAIDVDARLGTLRPAERQMVEIARAVDRDAAVLILDEPTSSLAAAERERLFAVIGELRGQGRILLYISHHLDELFRLADQIAVLRDGVLVESRRASSWSAPALIAAMVGRELAPAQRTPRTPGPPVLEGAGLRLHRGEIVGLAGLMGAGRTELAERLCGARPGEVLLEGRRVYLRSEADAWAHGIARVPEDRKALGLIPELGVDENIELAALRTLSLRQARRAAQAERAALRIKAAPRAAAMSGGNQQKTVLAKALLTKPRVLILDEPTRGIDVGARAEIHALIQRLAGEGLALLLISSEMEELLALADRVVVLRGGEIAAEVLEPTQEEVLRHAMPESGRLS